MRTKERAIGTMLSPDGKLCTVVSMHGSNKPKDSSQRLHMQGGPAALRTADKPRSLALASGALPRPVHDGEA